MTRKRRINDHKEPQCSHLHYSSFVLSRRPLMMYNFFWPLHQTLTEDGRSPSQCLQHQYLFICLISAFHFCLLISYMSFLICFSLLYYICQPLVSLFRMCLYALASIVVYAISYLFVLHCHFFILLLYSRFMMFLVCFTPVFYCA